MEIKLNLIGKTTRQELVHKVQGSNCSFNHFNALEEVPVLVFKDEAENCYTIKFIINEDECPSGWCKSTYAKYEIKKERISYDEIPTNKGLTITINEEESGALSLQLNCWGEVDNEIFFFSEEGEDPYYPCGGFEIKTEFTALKRKMSAQPIWVFYGDSATGKSTIAHETGRLVYETDSNPELPENLNNYEIIVVGNKYDFTLEEISSKITNKKIINVKFDD